MQYSFDHTSSTPLCQIMQKYTQDKGTVDILNSWHNYTTFYYSIFKNIREENIRLFELGTGCMNNDLSTPAGIFGKLGSVLYAWSEFFPVAQIFGANTDNSILFNTDKITTFNLNNTSTEAINDMWNNNPKLKENFDIIIEDGIHDYTGDVLFLENSLQKLKSKGYYIIGDIKNTDKDLFLEKIKEWEVQYPDYTFTYLEIPSNVNNVDNNLLVVNRL